MKKIYTTHDIALLCNVDISTVINWIDSGKLQAYKTPGGHRRIRQDNFLQFLKSYGLPIPRGMGGVSFSALIANNSPDIRTRIIAGLKTECPGIDFLQADDGFTAGKLLADKQPSLVILDIDLPGIEGCGACALIKSDRRLKNTKIIAITDAYNAGINKQLLEAGADDCIAKPLQIPELAASIRKMFP